MISELVAGSAWMKPPVDGPAEARPQRFLEVDLAVLVVVDAAFFPAIQQSVAIAVARQALRRCHQLRHGRGQRDASLGEHRFIVEEPVGIAQQQRDRAAQGHAVPAQGARAGAEDAAHPRAKARPLRIRARGVERDVFRPGRARRAAAVSRASSSFCLGGLTT